MVDRAKVSYTGTVPSTTLKIVGIDLTCLGESRVEGDEYDIYRHTDGKNGIYKRATVRNGKLVGAILLGDTRDTRHLQQLIVAEKDVSSYGEQLVNGTLDLQALARKEDPA
jgi:nitrite reductase (NADH) large subunit